MFRNKIKKIHELILWGKRDYYNIIKASEFIKDPDIKKNELLIVGHKNNHKWAILMCPCGCGEKIHLSLMKSYNPNWTLKIDKLSRPTLYPSIWKRDGCKSHFWIRKGKLIWFKDVW